MTSDGDDKSDDPWAEEMPETRVEDIDALEDLREAATDSSSSDVGPAPTLVGETIADRYRIERQIARGGMGLIYRAEQRKLERKVVIKVLPPKLVRDEQARDRFEREAKGLSNLQHPNVVTVHDFGLHQGVPYIAMEFLEGETLSKRLYRQTRIEIRPFLEIVSQILDALAEAHAEGVIHRDLKPENVMLCRRRNSDNFVKLLDFGLAKLAYKDQGITNEDDVVGTVSYMAPEYILGEGIDTRADVYSAAVLFYVMLSGRKPFDAEDRVQMLYAHVEQEPTRLEEVLPEDHEVPSGLIDLLHQCMAKDPDDRPRDANELLQWMLDHISHSKLRIPGDSGTLTPEPREVPSEIADASNQPRTESSSNPVVDSGPAPPADPSTEQAPVSAEEEPDSRHAEPATAVSAAAGMILAAAAIALFVFPLDDSRRSASDEGASAADGIASSAAADRPDYEAIADRIESRIAEGNFESAKRLLDGLDRNRIDSLELLDRLSTLRERLQNERLRAEAAAEADAGREGRALALYEKLLEEDGNDERARRALERMRAAQDAGTDGIAADAGRKRVVEIQSDPAGVVFVDGERSGETPLAVRPPTGSHEIEIRADGHRPWRRTVELDETSKRTIEASLQPTDSSGETSPDDGEHAEPSSSPPEEQTTQEDSLAEEPNEEKPTDEDAPETERGTSETSPDPGAESPPSSEDEPRPGRTEKPRREESAAEASPPEEETETTQSSEGSRVDEKSESGSEFRIGGEKESSGEATDEDESFRVE